MQGMISGVLVVGAFAAVAAGGSGFVATRLYRDEPMGSARWAGRPGQAGEPTDA
jgi:hypothetical protein